MSSEPDANAQPDIATLRRNCELAWMVWIRQAGGLQLIVLRDKGIEELLRLKSVVLAQHQGAHYLAGLRKLGIENDPPAIAAAKYHYLSNIIGGVGLEYIEETSKKVWIRYTHPNDWFHGSALLAVPASVQRAVFAGWHARNGEKIGCPRLGYVCTKVMQDGEPYDEGYFIEYDHEISPVEAIRFEAVTESPIFDPGKAPRLDPSKWPESRILRARRKYAGAFVRTYVRALWNLFGLAPACHIVSQTMSLIAVQHFREIKNHMGIAGVDVQDAITFLDILLGSRGDDYSIEMLSPSKRVIMLRSYEPFGCEIGEELRQACFTFPAMCIRLLNSQIRVTRCTEISRGSPVELWEISDVGKPRY